MKTLILLLLPFFGFAQQDTLKAVLKIQQGNYTKYVAGYVVLTKDCKVVEYLRINSWKRNEQLFPMKENVVDYRLMPDKTD
jgi:hypothetical protein